MQWYQNEYALFLTPDGVLSSALFSCKPLQLNNTLETVMAVDYLLGWGGEHAETVLSLLAFGVASFQSTTNFPQFILGEQ